LADAKLAEGNFAAVIEGENWYWCAMRENLMDMKKEKDL
jgi:hypothetical protein